MNVTWKHSFEPSLYHPQGQTLFFDFFMLNALLVHKKTTLYKEFMLKEVFPIVPVAFS